MTIVSQWPQDQIYNLLYSLVTDIVNSFRKDLEEHDRAEIALNPGVPFLHFAYHMGTHLVLFHPHNSPRFPAKGESVKYLFGIADREHILNNGIGDVTTMLTTGPDSDRYTIHYYNGISIKQINKETALVLAREHIEKVSYEWGKQ